MRSIIDVFENVRHQKSEVREVGYNGLLYKDTVITLQRKFFQPQTVVSA